MSDYSDVRCNFCNKHRHEVNKLIAGPGGVHICDECVNLSHRIVNEGLAGALVSDSPDQIPDPESIRAQLDEYIVGQDYAKTVLSVSAYNHYKRVIHGLSSVEKSNILLVGASGTGKTLFAQTLAKILSVPFAIADATTLTESGYVGEDVDAVVERLLSTANHDVTLAQKGIVFIDEIDKKSRVRETNAAARDVGGEGVQQALLRLIEGTTVKVKGRGRDDEPVMFDTSNVLFILGGAFVGLEAEIANRQSPSRIGFSASVSEDAPKASLWSVTHEDFVRYGMIPELMGRLPVIVPLEELTANELVEMMTHSRASALRQFESLLQADGIRLHFEDQFLIEVANLCLKRKVGARGIRSLLEDALLSIMYRAPALKKSGVTTVRFAKYPVDESSRPVLVYSDREESDTNYQLPRGTNER